MGTPPTAVLVGKLGLFGAALDAGQTWLAVVAVVNTLVSLAYYLRWLRPAFSAAPEPPPDLPVRRERPALVAAVAGAGGALGLGLLAGPLLEVARLPLLR